MKLFTTANCGRTPVVSLALEELGVAYEVEVKPDGSFTEQYQRMGPMLEDSGVTFFEHNAMLRHLARTNPQSPLAPADEAEACALDAWLDFSLSHVRAHVPRLREAMAASPGAPPPPELVAPLARSLGVLDRALAGRDYLLGRFTLADCAFAGLEMVSRFGPIAKDLTQLQAWLARITSRPAWARMKARAQG